MSLDPKRASVLGQIGMASRWAATVTPEARRAATQAARDARWGRYLARARSMDGGTELSAEQLAERANQLRRQDLARMRLKALEARRAA